MTPKVELHVHLEFTATPSLVRRLAQRNKFHLPDTLFTADDQFNWHDFSSFLKLHDFTSGVISTPEDYRDVTFEYLAQSAKEGVIYTELMSSPDHAANAGMSYLLHLEGISQGIKDAQAQYGIEGRIIITGVRHFGSDKVTEVAKLAAKHAHPWVVGLGLGGDEVRYPPGQFATAYRIAHEAGLGTTAHAGEMEGPIGIHEALTTLPITRLGHGVRVIEDKDLMKKVVDNNITLECCPTSNIALKVYPNYSQHPLRALKDAGLKITLNSDDPPYFATTMHNEYEVAKKYFGFTDKELLEVTRNGIDASFADPQTKQKLHKRVDEFNM